MNDFLGYLARLDFISSLVSYYEYTIGNDVFWNVAQTSPINTDKKLS